MGKRGRERVGKERQDHEGRTVSREIRACFRGRERAGGPRSQIRARLVARDEGSCWDSGDPCQAAEVETRKFSLSVERSSNLLS